MKRLYLSVLTLSLHIPVTIKFLCVIIDCVGDRNCDSVSRFAVTQVVKGLNSQSLNLSLDAVRTYIWIIVRSILKKVKEIVYLSGTLTLDSYLQ